MTVDNGAPFADYDAADYLAVMGLGSPVSLLVASSGTLAANSTTDIATFLPAALGYEAESIMIDGQLIGLGEAEASNIVVPEPATLALLFSFSACLAGYHGRRARWKWL